MKLDKTKEIFGLILWTIFIFVAKYIVASNSCGNYTYAFFPGFLASIGAVGSAVGALGAFGIMSTQGLVKSGFARRKIRENWRIEHAKMDAKDSSRQLEHYKNMYSNLSMSNPYLNMEKSMEDLTVNQQQYQFQRQAFQQSQKNILSTMQQGVGASGVASLAQSLVRQGEKNEQQMAANIAQQESNNRALALQQRERLQRLEREGGRIPTDFRAQQMAAMMGMAQQQYASDKDLEQQYHASTMQQASARISSNLSAFQTMLGGMT